MSTSIYGTDKEFTDLVGWHSGMSNEEYHASPGLSKSKLDDINKSIQHYLHRADCRRETPSTMLGTAAHMAILEPDVFDEVYVVSDVTDKRSKEWKKLEEVLGPGEILVDTDFYNAVVAMRKSAMSLDDPVIRAIDTGHGEAEGSLFTSDPRTGLLVKCRPDFIIPNQRVVVDIKSTKDASPRDFEKSCGAWRYDVQAAFYTDLVSNYFGGDWEMVFVAIENRPPYNAGVYTLSPEDVDIGRAQYKMNLQKYVDWAEGYDETIGYTQGRKMLRIPEYFRRGL